MRGVGQGDEWRLLAYPGHALTGASGGSVQAGTVPRVEALASPAGEDVSIRLQDQVTTTQARHQRLSRDPFDAAPLPEGKLPRGSAFGLRPLGRASCLAAIQRRCPGRGAVPDGRGIDRPPMRLRRGYFDQDEERRSALPRGIGQGALTLSGHRRPRLYHPRPFPRGWLRAP